MATIFSTSDFYKPKDLSYGVCVDALQDTSDSYMVYVTKEELGWLVWAEEHTPSEVSEIMSSPKSFKTKKAALEIAAEFATFFNELYMAGE
jgi:hypothetical protein